MSARVLSQNEIDNMFQQTSANARRTELARRAQPYNFRRPDRIAKDQLRSIYVLHEAFSRSLASSLSAYLRAYVVVNLVSVEQLSFNEFQQVLPSPTVVATMVFILRVGRFLMFSEVSICPLTVLSWSMSGTL